MSDIVEMTLEEIRCCPLAVQKLRGDIENVRPEIRVKPLSPRVIDMNHCGKCKKEIPASTAIPIFNGWDGTPMCEECAIF